MLINKKAFTLAELMLVFTVIGILTAILVPGLFLASPDKGELKAKKAYNTLTRGIHTLMNTQPYVETGSLDSTPYISGTSDDDKKARNEYLCNNLANILSVTNVNCTFDWVNNSLSTTPSDCTEGHTADDNVVMTTGATNTRNSVCAPINNGIITYEDNDNNNQNDLKSLIDTSCNAYYSSLTGTSGRNTQYNFKTSDGTIFGVQLVNYSNSTKAAMNGVDVNRFHGIICFSTDNLESQDYMFGIGVRPDGNIVAGQKLAKLLEDEEN